MVKASLELTAWEVQPEFEPRCTHDTLGQAVETWGGGNVGIPNFFLPTSPSDGNTYPCKFDEGCR